MPEIQHPVADTTIVSSSPTATAGSSTPLLQFRNTSGTVYRALYRFAMPPANAINMVLRRYLTTKAGTPGEANIRLIDNDAAAVAFNESQACWNLPATGEDWGATPTGGGALTGVNTTYDGDAEAQGSFYERSVQAQFEAALARGDAFFTLIAHLTDEGTGSNASLRYASREAATTSPPELDQRPHLIYDLDDSDPPTVAVTSHTDGQGVDTLEIELAGTAADAGEDASGVDSVEVRVNGGSWEAATGTTTWTKTVTLAPGANTIEVRATDAASNESDILELTVTVRTHWITCPLIAQPDGLFHIALDSMVYDRVTTPPISMRRAASGENRRALAWFDIAALAGKTPIAWAIRGTVTSEPAVPISGRTLRFCVTGETPETDDTSLYASIDPDSYYATFELSGTKPFEEEMDAESISALQDFIDAESAGFPVGLAYPSGSGTAEAVLAAQASDLSAWSLRVEVLGAAAGTGGRRALLGVGR